MANMCGGRHLQPNLRASPFVLEPFAVNTVDAVPATHYHGNHMNLNHAAAVLDSFDRTCLVTTPGYVDIRGVCPTDMDNKE